MPQPVEVSVGGRSYRVVASADAATLQRLAADVDQRLQTLVGSARTVPPQALVLVALALAHDLEQERGRGRRRSERSRAALEKVLSRIDAALGPELAQSST